VVRTHHLEVLQFQQGLEDRAQQEEREAAELTAQSLSFAFTY
jgi:hypothetical protein